MARQENEPNNPHYSNQTGHSERGKVNKALDKANRKGAPQSRGEMYIARRFMMRDPKNGKNGRG